MTRDDILTEQEAAELMRVTPHTVRLLGKRALIRRVPPARPPRYDRGSVLAYLARGVYDATDEPEGNTPSDRRYVGKTPGAMTEAARRLDEAMG